MGANRDLTRGATRAASATLLEKQQRRGSAGSSSMTTISRPRRLGPGVAPHEPRKRARPVTPPVAPAPERRVVGSNTEAKRRFNAVSVLSLPLLIGGVVTAMFLSGLSTQQTFSLQELQATERQLSNEVETLKRDVENVQSNAEIARRAADAEMVIPVTPGILEVEGDGVANEKRAPQAETQSIVDVNGAPVRPGLASSDPTRTEEISGALQPRPEGALAPLGSGLSDLPAGEGMPPVPEVPAPAPAPAPAPNTSEIPAER